VISRLKAAIKNESGVSILFVLGIMMMILAVGASVMAAAFGNAGIGVRQERHNRAMLLTDSIHRNIKHSLQMGDHYDFMSYLSGQIAWYIFENEGYLHYYYDDDGTPLDIPIPRDILLEVTIDDDDIDIGGDVTVTLNFAYNIGSPIDFIAPGDSFTTRVVQMSATMRVEVVVEVGGGERSITSRAYYEFFGSLLVTDEDDYIDDINYDDWYDWDGWEAISFQIISG